MGNEVIQPEGNYYDKYGSKNLIVRKMMKGFFEALDNMLEASEISLRGGDCLEAGCGEGHVTEHVSKWIKGFDKRVEFTAFDISEQLIEENKSKWPDVKYFSHNIYEPIDTLYLPDRETFDLVICSEVLEHLDRPEKALRNLMRYSDKFIISVPNEPIWRILNMARGKYIKELGNTPGHVQHFSERTLSKLLNQCSLKIVRIKKPLPWLMAYCEKEN